MINNKPAIRKASILIAMVIALSILLVSIYASPTPQQPLAQPVQSQGSDPPVFGIATGGLAPAANIWIYAPYKIGMNYYVTPSGAILACTSPGVVVSSMPQGSAIASGSGVCVILTYANGTVSMVRSVTISGNNQVVYGSFTPPTPPNGTNIAISALGDTYAVWAVNKSIVSLYTIGGAFIGNVTLPITVYTYVGTGYLQGSNTTTDYFVFASQSGNMYAISVTRNATGQYTYSYTAVSTFSGITSSKLLAQYATNGTTYQALAYGSEVYQLEFIFSTNTLTYNIIASAPTTITAVGSFYATPPNTATWLEANTPYVWVTYGNGTYTVINYVNMTVAASYVASNPYIAGPTAGPFYFFESGNATYGFDGYDILGLAVIYPWLGINFTLSIYGTSNMAALSGYNFSQGLCRAWFTGIGINATLAEVYSAAISNPFELGLTRSSLSGFTSGINWVTTSIVSGNGTFTLVPINNTALLAAVSRYTFSWSTGPLNTAPAVIDFMQSYGFLLPQGIPLVPSVANATFYANQSLAMELKVNAVPYIVMSTKTSVTNMPIAAAVEILNPVPVELIQQVVASIGGTTALNELYTQGYAEVYTSSGPVIFLYDKDTGSMSMIILTYATVTQENLTQSVYSSLTSNSAYMSYMTAAAMVSYQATKESTALAFLQNLVDKYGSAAASVSGFDAAKVAFESGSEVFTVDEAKALIEGIYNMLAAAYNTKYIRITPVLEYDSDAIKFALTSMEKISETIIEKSATNGMVDRDLVINLINAFKEADYGVALQPVTFISQTEWSSLFSRYRSAYDNLYSLYQNIKSAASAAQAAQAATQGIEQYIAKTEVQQETQAIAQSIADNVAAEAKATGVTLKAGNKIAEAIVFKTPGVLKTTASVAGRVLVYAGAFVLTADTVYALMAAWMTGMPYNWQNILGLMSTTASVAREYLVPVVILGNGPTLSQSTKLLFVTPTVPEMLYQSYEYTSPNGNVKMSHAMPILPHILAYLLSSSSTAQYILKQVYSLGTYGQQGVSVSFVPVDTYLLSASNGVWDINVGRLAKVLAIYGYDVSQYNVVGFEFFALDGVGVAPGFISAISGYSGTVTVDQALLLGSLDIAIPPTNYTTGPALVGLLQNLKIYVGNSSYPFHVVSYGPNWAYAVANVPPVHDHPPMPFFGRNVIVNGLWNVTGYYQCFGIAGYYNGTPVAVFAAPQTPSDVYGIPLANDIIAWNYTLNGFPTPLMYIFRAETWHAASAAGFLYISPNVTSLISRWALNFQFMNVMKQVNVNGKYYYVPVNSSVLSDIDPLATGRLWSNKVLVFMAGMTFPPTIMLGTITFNGTSPTNEAPTQAGLWVFSTVWQNATIAYNGYAYILGINGTKHVLGTMPTSTITSEFPPKPIIYYVPIGSFVNYIYNEIPPGTYVTLTMYDWVVHAQYLAIPQLARGTGSTVFYKPLTNVTCTVYAYVYNSVNTTPISGANVIMQYGAYKYTALTNSSGYATFTNVTPTTYIFTATAPGYLPNTVTASVTCPYTIVNIPLTTNTTSTTPPIRYPNGTVGYSITVYTYYENGQPAANAEVQVYNGTQLIASGVTDVQGEYVFTGIPAGTYTVTATLSGYTLSKTVTLPPSVTVTFTFPFLPNATVSTYVAITVEGINAINKSGVYPFTIVFLDASNNTHVQYTINQPTTLLFSFGHKIYYNVTNWPSGYTPLSNGGSFTAIQNGTLLIEFVPTSMLVKPNWTVTIVVLDNNNNPIQGANVTVTELPQNITISGVTGSNGEFQFMVPNGTTIQLTVTYYQVSFSGTYLITSNTQIIVHLNITRIYLPPGPLGKLVTTLIQLPSNKLLNVTGASVLLQNPTSGQVYASNKTTNGVATLPVALFNYYNVSASYDSYTQVGTKTIYPIFSVNYYNAYMVSPNCTVYSSPQYIGNNTLFPPLLCNGTVYVPLTFYATYLDGVPFQGLTITSNSTTLETDVTGLATVYYPVGVVTNNTAVYNGTVYYSSVYTIHNGTLILITMPFYSPIYKPYVEFTRLTLVSPGIAFNGHTSFNFTLIPEFLTNTPQVITVNYTVYMDGKPIETFLTNYTLRNGVNMFYTEFTVPPFLGNHTFIVKGTIIRANTTIISPTQWSNPVFAVGYVEVGLFIYPVFVSTKAYPYLLPEDTVAFDTTVTTPTPLNLTASVIVFINYTKPWGVTTTYESLEKAVSLLNVSSTFRTPNVSVPWGKYLLANALPLNNELVNAFSNNSALRLEIYPEVKVISVKAPPTLTFFGSGDTKITITVETNIYNGPLAFNAVAQNKSMLVAITANEETTQYTVTITVPVSVPWYSLGTSVPVEIKNLESVYYNPPWGGVSLSVNVYSLGLVLILAAVLAVLIAMVLMSRTSHKKKVIRTYEPYWV